MFRSGIAAALAATALFAGGLATGLSLARTDARPTDTPQRSEQQRTDLSGTANFEVIASILEVRPGESSRLHTHHGVEAYHVLQGAMVEPAGREVTTLATGFTGLNLRGVEHGAFTVRGDTALKLLTVHVVEKDKPLYDFVD